MYSVARSYGPFRRGSCRSSTPPAISPSIARFVYGISSASASHSAHDCGWIPSAGAPPRPRVMLSPSATTPVMRPQATVLVMPDGPSIDRTREALSRLRDDEPTDADERVDTDRHREATERVEDAAPDDD